jgi:hypothetical protein
MRDVGRMGESSFETLCRDVGITYNPVKVDETGWDYLLELPFDIKPDIPIDEQGAAIECKVQVKATDGRKKTCGIKLSNHQRLATTLTPSFYIFFEFDGKTFPQSGYIVHVDEKLISKILKRLRELEETQEKVKLNEVNLNINYDDSHKMESLSGECLQETILKHIGGSLEDYITKKREIKETTGFEDGSGVVTFLVDGKKNIQKLIKSSIGLTKNVEVKNFIWQPKRFDIISKKRQSEFPVGHISFPYVTPKTTGKIHFKKSKITPAISLKGKLYLSPLNSFFPEQFRLCRIEGSCFELIFNPSTGHSIYSFKLDEKERYKIHDLNEMAKPLDLLSQPNTKLIGQLDFQEFPKLDFEIVTHSNNSPLNQDIKNAIEDVFKLSSYFQIQNNLLISPYELIINARSIISLISLTTHDSSLVKAEFRLLEEIENVHENKTVCLFMSNTHLGNHVVGALFSIKGTLERLPNNYFRLVSNKLIVEKKIVCKAGDIIEQSDIKNVLNETENFYESQGFTVVMLEDYL